jgi:hypothetical protein
MIPVFCLFGRLSRALALIQLLWMLPVSAQWITQTNTLRSGWNAVYLHVDASHVPLTDLMASATSITEVWLWSPPSTAQFIESPVNPSATSGQWSKWTRTEGASSPLQRLVPNAAYYVKVSGNYNWAVQGKPVAPQYQWTSSGLNLIGFPTPQTNTVTYEQLLQPVPSLMEVSEIYRSIGGAFASGNPARVTDFARTVLRRGEAVWMRLSTGYNRYFGPFELDLSGARTVSFGKHATQFSLRIRNQIDATNTITLNLVPSEAPPTDQPSIVGLPPLLIRGALNRSTLEYEYQNLFTNQSISWTLPPRGTPGSDVQVVLGLARNSLEGSAGALSAGVLQFTDEKGLLRVDVAVSAEKASTAGLWVGEAQVSHVIQYLTSFERDPVGKPVIRLTEEDGAYSVLFTNSVVAAVPRNFPLRLIVHDDGTNAHLLQRVFLGVDMDTNAVVATRQDLLWQERLSSARRITAVHFPWTANNNPWVLSRSNNVYSTEIVTAFDQTSVNPFVHQYHPDHDNLNATFTQALPKGQESYGIKRQIWLSVQAAGSDYRSLTTGALDRNGVYDETITLEGTGSNARTFRVVGTFSLNRISDAPTLTR